ncbi:MAG: hypothetical protein AAFR65_07590 [Pseudomonadota bacterium]
MDRPSVTAAQMSPALGQRPDDTRLTIVLVTTAVLFFLALLPFELIPEIPVDIDAKPFFVPFVLCALLPSRRVGLSIGLGAALGEGLRDLMEGYELDDPIGFVGYILGFWLASAIFSLAPRNRLILVVGSVLGAGIQAVIEASSFLLFGSEGLPVALWSAAGNTISHGVIWGAIPLLIILPRLDGRVAEPLGFEPRGRRAEPLRGGDGSAERGTRIIASASDAGLAWAGADQTLSGFTETVHHGECLRLEGEGAEAAAFLLAGLAPSATGGRVVGDINPASWPGLIAVEPRAHVVAATALDQVASVLSDDASMPERTAEAGDFLERAGLARDRHHAFSWELTDGELISLALATAKARRPDLLIVNTGMGELNDQQSEALTNLISEQRKRGAVVLLGSNRPELAPDRSISVSASTERRQRFVDNKVRTERATIPVLQKGQSDWWRRRDPRVKWAVFLTLIVLIYLLPDWRFMAGAAALGVIVVATARPPWGWLTVALLVQLPNILGLIALPLIGEGTTSEELAFGLRLGLGWVAAILFGIGILSSMTIRDMVDGIIGLGLPRRFASSVGSAFVLTYLSASDLTLRLKAPRLHWRRPGQTMARIAAMIIPLFETVAMRGSGMAVGLATTGYDGAARASEVRSLRMPDWLLLLAVTTALIGSAWLRFLS